MTKSFVGDEIMLKVKNTGASKIPKINFEDMSYEKRISTG